MVTKKEDDMTVTADRFLADRGLAGTVLSHAERTLQNVYDEMSEDQQDLVALIVGAAVDEEDLEDYPEVAEQYAALTDEQKDFIDFLVGNVLAEDAIEHSAMMIDNFLAHYGVKGMKWGVIRDKYSPKGSLSRSAANTPQGRSAARAAVRSGNASAKQEHLAALKSTGHRAINALSGDKTFWRRMAITTGITTAMLGATAAAPFVLPAGLLSAVGATGLGANMIGSTASLYTTKELGIWTVAMLGGYGAVGTAAAGTAANVVGNTGRAIAGNALLNRSYDRLGKNIVNRQSKGRQRVMKTLRTIGGVRDVDLKR